MCSRALLVLVVLLVAAFAGGAAGAVLRGWPWLIPAALAGAGLASAAGIAIRDRLERRRAERIAARIEPYRRRRPSRDDRPLWWGGDQR